MIMQTREAAHINKYNLYIRRGFDPCTNNYSIRRRPVDLIEHDGGVHLLVVAAPGTVRTHHHVRIKTPLRRHDAVAVIGQKRR